MQPVVSITGAAKRFGRETTLALAGRGTIIHFNRPDREARQLLSTFGTHAARSFQLRVAYSENWNVRAAIPLPIGNCFGCCFSFR